ncbi:GDP-mannose 4,6-dehydratase [Patescibacteria group bacterium]|nr:GDP-mannose 4,6-dehydratase [Patescibacteria group bacterium]MBU1931388.1 GDP-mannose 4,6-dehydratase [Patescibacteria group bacterium]
MRKILITGGAGFIGSNLAAYWLKQGRLLRLYDNLSRLGSEKNLAWLKKQGNFELVRGGVEDWPQLKKAFKGIDAVVHLAGQVAVTTSLKYPRQDFEANALGSFNVLEAAREQKNPPLVVYASTNKVYGDLQGTKLTNGVNEDFKVDLYSPYGCSKGLGDLYTLDYARCFKLRTVVLRQSCIYGPRQFGNEDQGWVAHFAWSIIRGEPITIYGDGQQTRDLLYIDDLIKLYDQIVSQPGLAIGQVFNVGGGKSNKFSLLQMIDLLVKLIGQPASLKFKEARTGDQPVYCSNLTKVISRLGWQPTTSCQAGTKQLVNWIQNERKKS